MRTKKQALLLYVIACLAALLATIISSESLLLVAKPVVIPAIFFYYLSAKLTKTNPLVVLFMALSFTGDAILMLEIPNATLLIMVPYFLSYLILLYFVLSDTKRIGVDRLGLAVGIFILFLIIGVTLMLLQFFSPEQQHLVVPISVYGVVLALYAATSAAHFFSNASNAGFYMIISAMMCVVSDVFFVLFDLILQNPGFDWFNRGVQLFSYFFITKYFILRKR